METIMNCNITEYVCIMSSGVHVVLSSFHLLPLDGSISIKISEFIKPSAGLMSLNIDLIWSMKSLHKVTLRMEMKQKVKTCKVQRFNFPFHRKKINCYWLIVAARLTNSPDQLKRCWSVRQFLQVEGSMLTSETVVRLFYLISNHLINQI